MPIPVVQFTPESAGLVPIGTWFVQNVFQGQLATEARSDIPAALRVGYRAADLITTQIVARRTAGSGTEEGGEVMFLEEAGAQDALLQIQESLGIQAAILGGGKRGVLMEALMQRLMAYLEKLLMDFISGV